MRYTLRLLTLDQLRRAATLVCALELERQDDVARLGTEPAGGQGGRQSVTARTKVRQVKTSPKDKPSPVPLENCPWCGSRFSPSRFELLPDDDHPTELRIFCTSRLRRGELNRSGAVLAHVGEEREGVPR